MSTKYRAQILLEPEQHAVLAEIAQEEKRSISDLVREIIHQWLYQQDREAQHRRELLAIEELTRLRSMIQEEHGFYRANLIEEGRSEQEENNERVWRGEP